MKEMKHLAPTGLLFAFLLGLDFIFYPLVQPLDQISWFEAQDGLNPDGSQWLGPLVYIMGLSFGFSLYPREYEERTIDFLHTLPVTRAQIFVGKWLAAEVMMVLVLALNQVGAFAMQMCNANVLESGQFSLLTAAELWTIHLGLASAALAHGILFSFGRQYGLLMMALAGWAVSHWVSLRPDFSVISPFRLARPEYYGQNLLMPWEGLAFHLLVAVLALALSQALWSRRGHQLTRAFIDLRDTRWKRFGCGCLTFLMFFFMLIYWSVGTEPSEEEEESVYPSFQTARIETEFYNFTFPVNLRGRALELAREADPLYSEARARLGVEHTGIVVADLTDVSFEHLGIASREKIRMDITQHQEPALLRHVLFHESVHVLMRRVGGRRWVDFSGYTSFFDEGAAEFLAYESVNSSRDRAMARRHAIATYHRHKLRFKELVSQKTLSKRLDEASVYTVGELWVTALVDCYGSEAPGRVVEAIGRPDAPSDLHAVEFWQDTLQAAGYNLERVRSRWLKLMEEGVEQEAEFLEQLPRVWAVEADSSLILKTDRPLPEDWPGLVVRVRAQPGDRAEWLPLQDNVALLPRRYQDGFEYQVGVEFHQGTYAYWEEWKPVR